MEEKKPVLVLGVGNILLRDEGFGIHVVRKMMEMDLPANVEVIDGATGGFDLVDFVEGREKVVFVDVVQTDQKPGTLYRFAGEDLEDRPKSGLSLHEIDVSDLLKLIDMLGLARPEIIVIGIEPKDMATATMDLSPELEAQIPRVIDLVMKEIGS